jgi:hypothetical protein
MGASATRLASEIGPISSAAGLKARKIGSVTVFAYDLGDIQVAYSLAIFWTGASAALQQG